MTMVGAAPGCIAPSVRDDAGQLAREFRDAQPFRHVVIDGFLEDGFARTLLAQFPPFEQGDNRGDDGLPGAKSTFERVRALGDGYARLDDMIRQRDFLDLLGRITGIDGLLYDRWYLGGGTHENRDGATLDPHIDFNFHPLERWHRRLNLIIYLNEGWQPGWGGALELYGDPASEATPRRSVVPAFNRCVIFETNEHSWHGFGRITLPPTHHDLTRRSLALYFYTPPVADAAAGPDAHSTVYVSRRLPSHLHAGHVLDESDMLALRNLERDNDGRIAIQYEEIARLMTLARAHERGVAGSVLYLARKAMAAWRRRRLAT